MTPFLEIRRLNKKFGAFTALDSVDLSVAPGEFVCFLGPSGCGKTTLLRAIAGLDRQDSGEVLMDGRDVSDAPPAERDFGIVFQSYALFPNLTVAANVGYGLVSRGVGKPAIAARVAELLETVGLSDQARKYPGQLSGGQQQRVALARALAGKPKLLLLDEPLSALDARVRLKLRDELRALQQRLGVTTIMVTHDQDEALSLADRIVVMNRGRIEQVGPPQAIYDKPANRFVADFIGHMNFMPATVRADGVTEAAGMILAANGAAPAPGPTTLGVRPEAIVVARGAAGDGAPASIASVAFLGAHCRLGLTLAGARLEADVPAAIGAGLTAGDQVRVSLPPSALRFFDRDAGG